MINEGTQEKSGQGVMQIQLHKYPHPVKYDSSSSSTAVSLISRPFIDCRYVISKLSMAIAVCLLEDCIDRLNILGNLRNKPHVTPDITYKSIPEGIKAEFRSQLFHLESMEPYEDHMKMLGTTKIQQDIGYLETVLQQTLNQLLDCDSYKFLVDRIAELKKIPIEEKMLFDEERANNAKVQELTRTIQREKIESSQELAELTKNASKMKDEVEDMKLEAEIRLRTSSRWEAARISQNKLKQHLMDNVSIEKRAYTEMKFQQEEKVHAEILKYVSLIQQETEDEMRKWQLKYEVDIQQKDSEILILLSKKYDQIEEMKDMTIIALNRRAEMDEWIAEKDERQRQAELIVTRNAKATKIQAWWRGLRVRRRFGPYKKLFKTFDEAKAKPGKKRS